MTAFSAPFNHQCPYPPCPSYNIFYFPLYFFFTSVLPSRPFSRVSLLNFLSQISNLFFLFLSCQLRIIFPFIFLSPFQISFVSFPLPYRYAFVQTKSALDPLDSRCDPETISDTVLECAGKDHEKITRCIFLFFVYQTSDFFLLFEKAFELD